MNDDTYPEAHVAVVDTHLEAPMVADMPVDDEMHEEAPVNGDDTHQGILFFFYEKCC